MAHYAIDRIDVNAEESSKLRHLPTLGPKDEVCLLEYKARRSGA